MTIPFIGRVHLMYFVRFITWSGDMATAKKINEKSNNLKNIDKYEYE